MEVKELRIGGLFVQKGSQFVESATFETFELLSRNAIIIDAIPLTEEWLLKLQLEKLDVIRDYGQEYYYKGISIFLKECQFRYYLRNNRHWVIYEFVHEIQNLFGAFGEELTIKE